MSPGQNDVPPLILDRSQLGTSGDNVRIAPQGPGVQQRLGQNVGTEGNAVAAEEYRPWRLAASFAHRGWLYTELPAADLRPLSAVFELSRREALAVLERYALGAEELDRRGERHLRAVNLQNVFFDREGTVYFLPAPVEEMAMKNLPEEEQRRWYRQWVPSSLGGQEAAAYQCAAMLFGVLTGKSPGDEELPVILHPHLYLPELAEGPADRLYRLLRGETSPRMDTVCSLIAGCRAESAFDAPTEEERARRSASARRLYRRNARAYRRTRFLKRNAPPAIIGIIVIVAGLLMFHPFFSGKEEPATAGLSPEEVIRLYYESHNSLDHQTMGECTAGGVRSGHMHQVTTLFVINRIRKGVEGIQPFMSVEEWKRKGRPSPGRDTFVFGIADLSIEQLSERGYRAVYTKYSTLPPRRDEEQGSGAEQDSSIEERAKEIESTGRVRAFRITERIEMRKTGEGWKISSLKEEERRPVDADS